MREIILDTETTGMDPSTGDRIVEIGCVECMNHVPTGKTLHLYLNPERDVPAGAVAVHGLTWDFLKKHPTFGEVVDKFVDFIGDDICVAHNADFDMKFLNSELKTLGFPTIPPRRVIDTVAMARRKFPGSPASLDALCRRFNIDLSDRTLHGALLDAQLLSEVYLELMGGRQHGLTLEPSLKASAHDSLQVQTSESKMPRPVRHFPAMPGELAAHEAMVDKIKNALWKKVS